MPSRRARHAPQSRSNGRLSRSSSWSRVSWTAPGPASAASRPALSRANTASTPRVSLAWPASSSRCRRALRSCARRCPSSGSASPVTARCWPRTRTSCPASGASGFPPFAPAVEPRPIVSIWPHRYPKRTEPRHSPPKHPGGPHQVMESGWGGPSGPACAGGRMVRRMPARSRRATGPRGRSTPSRPRRPPGGSAGCSACLWRPLWRGRGHRDRSRQAVPRRWPRRRLCW